jgi:hypothetical protein
MIMPPRYTGGGGRYGEGGGAKAGEDHDLDLCSGAFWDRPRL